MFPTRSLAILILVVKEHTLNSKNLDQGLENISCEGPDNKYFRFVGPHGLCHNRDKFSAFVVQK